MISVTELKNLCIDRLNDAKTLYDAGRFDSAFYLSGYVVELGLKKKICKTLDWDGYPSTRKEFENLSSFKTHDLDVLLQLTGASKEIRDKLVYEWSTAAAWRPEIRYSSSAHNEQTAKSMLLAAEKLLDYL